MEVSSIAEQLLFTTVRIETRDANGVLRVGTGFIFEYGKKGESENSLTWVTQYLVTCKHVVENSVSGRLTFSSLKSEKEVRLGEKIRFVKDKEFVKAWYTNSNPDIDIAIFPILELTLFFSTINDPVFYRAINKELIPDETTLNEIDALEEVIFIGYPWGLWDEKNNLPIFRKGITASPISLDFNGEKKFLIDASVFPGSSGSPVFLFNQGSHNPKSGGIRMGTRLKFLGVVSEAYFREVEGKIEYVTKPTVRQKNENVNPVPITNQFLNIGIVFKASAIVDTIEEFLPQYRKWREKMMINLKKSE